MALCPWPLAAVQPTSRAVVALARWLCADADSMTALEVRNPPLTAKAFNAAPAGRIDCATK
jgi:hypothetical protein